MQRPEAWPRPHLGEGAAAATAGGPAGLRLQEPSLYTVKAVFILDNDGHRLLAKYYDDTFPSMKEQMAFEKNVFSKTSRTDRRTWRSAGCWRTWTEPSCVILEGDPEQVIQKVNFRADDSGLTEQSMAQVGPRTNPAFMELPAQALTTSCRGGQAKVLQSAKEQIKWSLLK
ncbi:coatomer subunit zeta-2 isoform X7 [Manis pentadactyla]|uniref:coatomer subunit zeta-2 isoform X7 n=1 Tax=Manis pentadactyla TaxID=143292 RepID=UPI00255D0C76|nr:coatomer subunit zeta-2 isoform X7 [Manis pentadactyla]